MIYTSVLYDEPLLRKLITVDFNFMYVGPIQTDKFYCGHPIPNFIEISSFCSSKGQSLLSLLSSCRFSNLSLLKK